MDKRRKYKGKFIDTELDEQLSRVKFFVEADSYAQHELWAEHSSSSLRNKHNKDPEREKYFLDWQQESAGFSLQIGKIRYEGKDYPVNVSFSFAFINEQYVCFYYACSLLIHHGMVDDFLRKNWPVTYDKGTRLAYVDASNFHNCSIYLREEKNKRYKLTTHD